MQPPAVWESLELVAAPEVELHLGGGADELADNFGNEDLSALGLSRNASRDVDRRAEDVAGFFDHLACVEADADLELPFRVLLAVFGDRALDVDRAFHAVTRRPEADHEAVAETFDPAAAVLRDALVDDRLVRPHDLVRRGEAARGKQPCRFLDIGEHDRHGALGLAHREAADDRLSGQRSRCVDGLSEAFGDLSQEAL